MNAKPVRGSSDEHSKKKEDKRIAPPEAFREQLRVAEIDPEAKGKWKNKQFQALESAAAPQEALPPPTQIMSSSAPQTYEGSKIASSQPTTQTTQSSYYVPPPTQTMGSTAPQTSTPPPTQTMTSAAPQTSYAGSAYVAPLPQQVEPLPTSYNFWHQERDIAPPTQTSQSQESTSSDKDQSGKQEKEALAEELTEDLILPLPKGSAKGRKQTADAYQKAEAKVSPTDTQNLKKTDIDAALIEKTSAPETAITPLPKEKKTTTSQIELTTDKETKKPPIAIKKQDLDSETSYQSEPDRQSAQGKGAKKVDKIEDSTAPVQAHSMSLTPEIQSQAFQGVSSYINPKVEALFQNMVGAIIQTTKKGITKTEILLNQPNMKSSQFYGSKITLTRYSTNPYSFNITLSTANPKALTQFNNQLDGLKTAFVQGNFDFKVGRLEAHYISDKKENFLFRRKEGAGEKEMGSKKDEKQ